ncbi:MAG: hypothetical protein D3914_00745 [Candidatus Electrothrix sp. LOE2]|nr:hypothetical protein [Candidatus Electrothrix sp. LOE2]
MKALLLLSASALLLNGCGFDFSELDDKFEPLGCYELDYGNDPIANLLLRPPMYWDRVDSCDDRCWQCFYNDSHELVPVLVESCRDGVRTPLELWVK